MARNSQSETQYFDAIKNFLHRQMHCEFDDSNGFPDPTMNGHPIDLERVDQALRRTAEICLGFGHQMYLHGSDSPSKVGQILRHIAQECAATEQCATCELQALGVDVYGVFITAYTYAGDRRSLMRTLRNHPSPVIQQAAIAA